MFHKIWGIFINTTLKLSTNFLLKYFFYFFLICTVFGQKAGISVYFTTLIGNIECSNYNELWYVWKQAIYLTSFHVNIWHFWHGWPNFKSLKVPTACQRDRMECCLFGAFGCLLLQLQWRQAYFLLRFQLQGVVNSIQNLHWGIFSANSCAAWQTSGLPH